MQIDMPWPCNISCFIQSGHCIVAITKCYCILLKEFTLHSDCLGIVTIPEIYKYVTSLQILKSQMSKAGRGRGVLRPKWSWSTKGSVLYLALAIFVTVPLEVEWILSSNRIMRDKLYVGL